MLYIVTDVPPFMLISTSPDVLGMLRRFTLEELSLALRLTGMMLYLCTQLCGAQPTAAPTFS